MALVADELSGECAPVGTSCPTVHHYSEQYCTWNLAYHYITYALSYNAWYIRRLVGSDTGYGLYVEVLVADSASYLGGIHQGQKLSCYTEYHLTAGRPQVHNLSNQILPDSEDNSGRSFPPPTSSRRMRLHVLSLRRTCPWLGPLLVPLGPLCRSLPPCHSPLRGGPLPTSCLLYTSPSPRD